MNRDREEVYPPPRAPQERAGERTRGGADARRREQKPRPKERLPTAAERHEAGGADEAKSHPDRCSKHSIVEPPENYPGTENKAEIIRGESYKSQCLKFQILFHSTRT